MSFRKRQAALTQPQSEKYTSRLPQIQTRAAGGRTFLSFSASLTIEAALAMPLFMFIIACVMHFLLLLSLQTDIQIHLDEAARQTGKRAYAADESEILTLISSASLTLRAQILDDQLTSHINRSRIPGGTGGFHTLLSTYDKSSGELDVTATYSYVFPYVPARTGTLNFMQHCFSRAWIGYALDQSQGDTDEEEHRTVYITPTGRAWHSTPSCSYLDLTITTVPYAQVTLLRNASGGIYHRCKCAEADPAFVYITDYGDLFHSDPNCFALKRTVLAVDISEVGGRHPCKKCASQGSAPGAEEGSP